LYNYYIEEINADPIDLLGPPVDDAENEMVIEEEEEKMMNRTNFDLTGCFLQKWVQDQVSIVPLI